MIEPAIRQLLIADAAVVALVSDRVFFGLKPQNERRASIILTLVSHLHYHHMTGSAGYATGRMQVDCQAPTYPEVKALAAAAIKAIDNYASPEPTGPIAYAVTLYGTVLAGIWEMTRIDDGSYRYDDGTTVSTITREHEGWRFSITRDDGGEMYNAQWSSIPATLPPTEPTDWTPDFGNVFPVLYSIVTENPPAADPHIDYIEVDDASDTPMSPLEGKALPTFGVTFDARFQHSE